MSVQATAAFARATAVGKAEQMVRNAGGTLGGFPVAQRVGAGRESLLVAERLLMAALAQIRTVQDDLELAIAAEHDTPAAPAPGHAGLPEHLTEDVLSGVRVPRRLATPLSVRRAATGPGVVR